MREPNCSFGKIVTIDDLAHLRLNATFRNLHIACATGCFDILHGGHVRFLEKAKEYAEILVVGVIHDEAYRPLKNREPVLREADRIYTVSRLACVSHAVLFGSEDELLLQLTPNIVIISPTSPPKRISDKERIAKTISAKAIVIEEQSQTHSTDLIARIHQR